EPAEVLQALGGRTAAGPGHTGDDHQLRDRGALALVGRARTHLCPVSVGSLCCMLCAHRSCPRSADNAAEGTPSSSMISPVAVFTAGADGAAPASAAATDSAVLRPMPDTSQISSLVA